MQDSDFSFEVDEEIPDHHFRTEIPNILFELGLDPFTLATYCYLKKIAGDRGRSWMSNEQLANYIGISKRKLIDIIKFLETIHPILETPLIKITHRIKSDGSKDTNLITIVNIWKINGNSFRNKNQNKKGGGSAPHALGGSARGALGSAPRAHKEEPYQEEPSLKEEPPPPPNPQDLQPDVPDSGGGGGGSLSSKDPIPVYDFLDPLDIPTDDKQRLSGFEKGLVWRVIKFCQRPAFRPNKSLSHALFYYCKNPEKMDDPVPQEKPVPKEIDLDEFIYANKEYALEFIKQNWNNLSLRRAVNDRVNFVRIGNDELYYKDPKFKELFAHYIGKLRP